MLMRLEMPFVDPIIENGTIAQWHVGEGDAVAFGAPLCDVLVEEASGIKRSITAYQLLPRGRKMRSAEKAKRTNLRSLVHIRASDQGFLRRIEVQVGEPVTVGGVMAILSTSADEPLDGAAAAPTFRAVGNIAEPGGE